MKFSKCVVFLIFLIPHIFALNCTTDQFLDAQQKCDPLVEKLDGLVSEYRTESMNNTEIRNISNLFVAVQKCFQQFNCSEANDFEKQYNYKKSEFEIANSDINSCLLEFYGAIYEGTYNCTDGYQWFSRNENVKRNAYNSGKSCFLEIVGNECSNISSDYLHENYDALVDLLTVKPEGPRCVGLYYELNELRCNQPMSQLMLQGFKSFGKLFGDAFKNEDKFADYFDDNVDTAKVCASLKDCMLDSCTFNKDKAQNMELICGGIQQLETVDSGFTDCIWKLINDDENEYHCMNISVTDSSGNSRKQGFMEDMECTKSVMKSECGEAAIQNFVEHWKFLKDGLII